MGFLGTLPLDVKILLIGSALALVAALFSGTKRNEYRYVALFTVMMAVAGYRFHVQGGTLDDSASVAQQGAVQPVKAASTAKPVLRSTAGKP